MIASIATIGSSPTIGLLPGAVGIISAERSGMVGKYARVDGPRKRPDDPAPAQAGPGRRRAVQRSWNAARQGPKRPSRSAVRASRRSRTTNATLW